MFQVINKKINARLIITFCKINYFEHCYNLDFIFVMIADQCNLCYYFNEVSRKDLQTLRFQIIESSY